MHSSKLTWREFLVQALILFVLLIPAYPRVFTHGELISSADLMFKLPPWDQYAPEGWEKPANRLMFDPLMAFRPDYLLVQQSLLDGEWPTWNNLEYAGVPLLANCQSTVFYLPRLLLLVFDVDLAMTLFVLIKLWLCGATAYICARLLKLSIPASRFFSIAWMLGSFCLIWSNWPITDVSSWVPILFLGIELILDGRYRRGFFGMALGGTLILLAGHPETAFTMSLGMGVYFLARLIWERRWGKALWTPILLCSAAWGIALLIYAVQLLPFLEYLANSYTFNERDVEELDIPMPAGALITFWIPRFFGTWAEDTFWDPGKWNSNITAQQYPGMAVWCGVMLVLAGLGKTARSRKERARIGALLIAAVVGVLLAFNFPTLAWIHKVPLFSSLLEIYHVCFALFAIPFLGAMGLERWFSRPRRLKELLWLVPLAVLVAGGAYFLLDFNRGLIKASGVLDYIHAEFAITAAMAAVAVLILAASCLWWRPKVFWAALTLFLVVDLLVATRGLNPTLPRKHIFPDTKLTVWMQEQPKPCRMGVAEAAIISGAIANYGVEEWLGYDGLFSERPIRFQTMLGPEVWDAMEPTYSIQYYLNDPDFDPMFPLEELVEAEALKLKDTLDGLDVYENVRAFPRAYLVGGVEVIPDRDALFERMLSEDFDPALATAAQTAPADAPTKPGSDLGEAEIAAYEATHVAIDVSAKQKAILVLADSFYPGWQAYVDDERTEMFPAYYLMRGVVVPPGEHTVEFFYRPASLRIGLAISTAGLLLGIVLAAFALRKRRAT